MAIPTLLLRPEGSRDRRGLVTPTITGAVRTVAGQHGKAWFVEEATTNLLRNPSAEVDTSNTNALIGATIARDTTTAFVGGAAFRVATPGAAVNEGVAPIPAPNMNLTGSARTYISSCMVKGPAGATLKIETQLIYTSGGGTTFSVAKVFTCTGEWQQVTSNTVTTDPAKTLSYPALILRTDKTQALTFWVDACQLEEKAYATSYCDGSLGTGYTWAGTPHASTSTRAVGTLSVPHLGHLDGTQGEVLIRFRRDMTKTGNSYLMGAGSTAGAGGQIGLTTTANPFYLRGWTRVKSGTYNYVPTNSSGMVTVPTRTPTTAAFAWSAARMRLEYAGTVYEAIPPDAPTTLGNVDVYFGTDGFAQQSLNGLIESVAVFDRPLTRNQRDTVVALPQWEWGRLMPRVGKIKRVFTGGSLRGPV